MRRIFDRCHRRTAVPRKGRVPTAPVRRKNTNTIIATRVPPFVLHLATATSTVVFNYTTDEEGHRLQVRPGCQPVLCLPITGCVTIFLWGRTPTIGFGTSSSQTSGKPQGPKGLSSRRTTGLAGPSPVGPIPPITKVVLWCTKQLAILSRVPGI